MRTQRCSLLLPRAMLFFAAPGLLALGGCNRLLGLDDDVLDPAALGGGAGQAGAAGAVVSAGSAGSAAGQGGACSGGLARCAGECVDTLSSKQHCGGCDRPCSILCAEGQCLQVKQLSSGWWHTCALMSDRSIYCWGENTEGRLGWGTPAPGAHPRPGRVQLVPEALEVRAGDKHTCALLPDQRVACWGGNAFHEQGGPGPEGIDPTIIEGVSGIVSLLAAHNLTCAIDRVGSVWCWGRNELGQCGNGAATDTASPGQVPLPAKATKVAVGYGHACALLEDSTVRCWGSNKYSETGDGTTEPLRLAPTQPDPPVLDAIDLVASGAGTCVRHESGRVSCWGLNQVYRYGPPPLALVFSSPREIPWAQGASELAMGYPSLFARIGSSVFGDGKGIFLGSGDTTDQASKHPASVLGLPPLSSLALMNSTSECGLALSGEVYCWGENLYGALGGSSVGSIAFTAVRVDW